MPAPRLDQPALWVVWVSGPALTEGVETTEIDGVQVRIFSPEKTVADCFEFRNKIGLDVALEALRDGWEKGKLKMDDLWHYAAIDRVSNVMRPSGKRHRMTRTLPASIRARLKQNADAAKENFALTLGRYGLERLLCRISISPHCRRSRYSRVRSGSARLAERLLIDKPPMPPHQ